MQKTVLKLTYAGIFIALSVVLTRTVPDIPVAGFPVLRLNMGFIPIILAGMLLGWQYGFAVGALADIIGFFFSSGGYAYFPGFTLTSALVGILPCLTFVKVKSNALITLIGVAVTTYFAILMNCFWQSVFFGAPVKVILVPGLIYGLIKVPIYTFFVYTLKRALQRTLVYKSA